jgi:hypothetical protein
LFARSLLATLGAPTAARLIDAMAQPAPSASSEHLDKIVKGLRACVPASHLQSALQRNRLPLQARAQRVPLAAIRQLVTELAEEQQEPWLLVRAFSHLNYTEAFLATTYLGNARTLCDAISLSKRYFHQNSDLATLALELNSGQARIVVTPTPEAHATEQQLVAALYAVMRTCQGLGLQQASANLAGMSDSAQDACRRLLRLPVTAIPGEQRLELQFPALELARALNTTQPNIARLARRERQLIRSTAGHCWSESVQLLLTALLPRGETRISRCASLLAVAPRTLQRKLTTEQQPFSALLATVRQRPADRGQPSDQHHARPSGSDDWHHKRWHSPQYHSRRSSDDRHRAHLRQRRTAAGQRTYRTYRERHRRSSRRQRRCKNRR